MSDMEISELTDRLTQAERERNEAYETAEASIQDYWRPKLAAAEARVHALEQAAKVALHEMCNTVAPRNSFTDAVDALDAALSAAGATAGTRVNTETN